jgi:carbon-monoxide dehydrogenase large subunit
MARIVASELELTPERVRLVQGDTLHVRTGTGSFASRTMQVGGAAASEAAKEVLKIAHKRAAGVLEVDEADLVYEDGQFRVRGAAEASVELFDLARDERLAAEYEAVARQGFPYGSYVAIVAICEETGRVKIERLVAVEDCGTVIDIRGAEDQVVGSIAQGIGQALYEECIYDDQGQPLTASMMDYLVPTAMEVPVPELSHIETPHPFSAIGAKGVGEAGCIGAPPAIANAIADALQLGEGRLDPPFTPERVWRLVTAPRS